MNFENYITKENLQNIIDAKHEENKIFNKAIAENFTIPFSLFLTDLNNNNQLSTIENSEGHETIFSYHWNRFVKDKEEINNRISSFLEPFLFKITYNQADIDETYSSLIEKINSGNFKYYELYHDICSCERCSQKMILSIENWKLKFSIFEKKLDGSCDYSHFTKPEDCLPNMNYQLDVNFPSGELLITDWIRIPDFTNHVEVPPDKRYTDFSLNHLLGRKNTTQHYAENFNFIFVSLSNIKADAYLDNGNLVIGCENYNEESGDFDEIKDLELVSSICTDLWGATIIDKQQLIQILIDATGDAEKANIMVQDYIDEYLDGKTVKVEPGNYSLSFNPDFENFKDLDETYSKKMEAYFTVSKLPKPTHKIKLG